MKTLLALALAWWWPLITLGDNTLRPLVRPCRVMLYLPWLRIPYAHTPMDVTLRDGKTYTVTNPEGHACEPCFGARDYFLCHGTLSWDALNIEAAQHAGTIPLNW